MKIKIIITTTDSKIIADKISNELVNNNLSSCVQIINNINSTYTWKNKIVNDLEFLLFIKTSVDKIEICRKVIEEIHNYDIPELICIDAEIISNIYKDWFLKKII